MKIVVNLQAAYNKIIYEKLLCTNIYCTVTKNLKLLCIKYYDFSSIFV